MIKKILLGALISSTVFGANQAELNVNNKEVEGQFRFDLSKTTTSLEGAFAGVRILNGDDSNSNSISNIDPLMEVSFLVMRPVNKVEGLSFGLGIKGEYTKLDGNTYVSIPLGIEAEMKLPIVAPVAFYVGGALYYAPSVLSLQDADEYLEARIHFDVELIKNGRIEVGYRKIDTDIENRNVTYNDAMYVGFRYDF